MTPADVKEDFIVSSSVAVKDDLSSRLVPELTAEVSALTLLEALSWMQTRGLGIYPTWAEHTLTTTT